ncbi:hypothetical protein FIV06_15720 [Labrenzia sp. THAF191b]|uniref:hypothetical protein n=1 Tax=unclassified Labrenzia TaxID=2648686 RepID=UPI001267FD5B|nr:MULTISPECIES: hypothetical protein [unclassified Labrenzia]QFS98876.1 hypothetical protein FIV06_15720 [Labrenzia sp. THAF191b]QFT05190.1 hypothetical protein FIV05_15715 [Labrenzia sp. THAF191a]QFT16734.1 hypothetical protein FIV03_15730 [Labrenzia sp. THAF187b]
MARKTQTGIAAIQAHFKDAQRRLEERASFADPDPNVERNGIRPGKWMGAPWDNMPPDCPVKVLGHDGNTIFIVSATGQLHAVEAEKCTLGTLASLFAPYVNYLYWAWPAFKKIKTEDDDGNEITVHIVDRVERDKAMICLVNEGKRRGLFDPERAVRGRGGWLAENGRYVWNSGEYLWMVDDKGELQAAEPGELGGYLYTRAPDVDRPWESPVAAEESPAVEILQTLRTWNWERPYLDPVLFLGWLICAYMGGALAWRPAIFTTGGAGVGKSTLHKITQAILNRSLFALVDTTAAGIYQHVKQDSLAVTVDELEAKKGSSKAMAVIELARLASSGGRMSRGGANHEGTTFQARNCFMFSAIIPPPMGVQDKTRMAILNLKKLERKQGKEPVVHDTDGRMILRQIMDGWTEFGQRILPDWKTTLHMAGCDARAMDTYGTLLAAAELVVGQDALEEIGLEVSDQERLANHLRAALASEFTEQVEKWQECLEHLLAAPLDAHRNGERLTVGGVLLEFEKGTGGLFDINGARERLALVGLGLLPAASAGVGPFLAVPTGKHPALNKVFQESDFYEGGWSTALKQAPEDLVLRGGQAKTVKIQRSPKHCLLGV